MNMQIKLLCISLVCIMLGALYYQLNPVQSADYHIAIFQPAIHPSLEAIADGFKEGMSKSTSKRIIFHDYNAAGNSTLLRAQADEIVQQNYDLVFTIGAHSSQMVYHVAHKKGDYVPQVFAVVDDPLSIGIVKSLELSGTNVTGVLATRLYQEQIAALLNLKPTIKRVLLVYNPAQGSGLEKDRQAVEQILHEQGLTLQAVEVAHHNEIIEKVPAFLTETDVVLVLMDNTVVSGITSLVALCNRYGVLLYASDLGSGDKGAALSFGADDYHYGTLGAELALTILEKKHDPSSIPLTKVLEQRIKVNTKTMHKQGLSLTNEQLQKIVEIGMVVR
ncbi:MAG TPA: ABC transporter substrate-binding protein [Parachlamydiaceae bacterium]|nr:ABC transporter substrate-binding protein [Parachlamydiaceae bacterium]